MAYDANGTEVVNNGTIGKPLLQAPEDDGNGYDIAETYNWLGKPASQSSKLGGNKTFIFTLGTICLSYIAFFGIFFNIVVFFIDVLDAGNASAANNANYWLGTQFVCAIFGAFVAEASLGRLWTCALFLVVNVLGVLLMTISVVSTVSEGATVSAGYRAFFYVAMYLVALGMGAFQPALQSLGADQFDTVAEKSNFFTWYLVLDNVGMVLADTIMVYIMVNIGWTVGFWVCTAMAGATVVLFFAGMPFYRQLRRHGGNPYAQALQVMVSAIRKWKVEAPFDSHLLYENELDDDSVHDKLRHSQSWRFLDKAATLTESEQVPRDPWRLCTVTQVEAVKQVLRLLPVWGCNIVFYTIYGQAGTFFIEQGLLMDTRMGGSFHMEAATMNLFNLAAVIFGPPIYDRLFVPIARRFSGFSRGLTPLQRMGGGFILSAVSMAMAAVVETLRLRRSSSSLSELSIFWQVPQYLILGCAQFLGAIAQLEFFYMEAPESLRSLGSSFYGTAIALGNYFSSLLVIVVNLATAAVGQAWIPRDLNQGHLDYFFWLLAGFTSLNLVVFLFCANSFQHAHPHEYQTSSPSTTTP